MKKLMTQSGKSLRFFPLVSLCLVLHSQIVVFPPADSKEEPGLSPLLNNKRQVGIFPSIGFSVVSVCNQTVL